MVFLGAMLWMPIYLAGPDGLEQVTFDLSGDDEYEPESDYNYDRSPFPDYEFLGINNGYVHTWLIGLIGAVITFAVMFGLLKFMMVRKVN